MYAKQSAENKINVVNKKAARIETIYCGRLQAAVVGR